MKPISKAELKLEKYISKLKGQLASAQYALDLLKNGNAEIPSRRSGRRMTQLSSYEFGQGQSNEIPLFS